LLVYSEVRSARWKIALLIGIACAGLAWMRIPLTFQFPSQYQKPGDHVSFYDEGILATTKVFMNPDTGEKLMSIDGIVIGGTTITDYKQQILAHLPKLLLKEYKTELSVGLGSGILLGESARYPKLESLVCVEIEPGVVEGAGQFAVEHGDVLNDAKVQIVVDDVGNYLRTTDRRFDIISADEKTAEEYASNGFSYSAEYYALLTEHLSPDGLSIQWVPGDLPHESFLMVLRTFAGAFPHVSAWYFPPIDKMGLTNVFLVGSLKQIEIDRAWMQTVIEDHGNAPGGLQKYGLTTADAILAHYVSADAVLRRAIPDGPINSLEYPRYEFYSPRDFAAPVSQRVVRNLDFLVSQRQSAEAEFLAAASTGRNLDHLGKARAAEGIYLAGQRRKLMGSSIAEVGQFYDQAVELAPWNWNLRLQVVRLYWNEAGMRYLKGDVRGFLDLMRKAVQVDPEDGEIRYYYGLALWRTGDVYRAIEQMEDAVAKNPRLLQPHRGLAMLRLQGGDFEAAARHLEAILAIHPDDVFSLATYGIHLAERENRLDEATALVERAYGIAPTDAAVIDGRAWLTYLGGDRATARRIVERGGDYFNGNPGFARRRSVILQTGMDASGR
jgi:spermidine synthase/Flp pilus assembly protein TadD